MVEAYRRKCLIISADLRKEDFCKAAVNKVIKDPNGGELING